MKYTSRTILVNILATQIFWLWHNNVKTAFLEFINKQTLIKACVCNLFIWIPQTNVFIEKNLNVFYQIAI